MSQGKVWSVPFLFKAIDDIIKCVTFPLFQRVFADDYSISLQSCSPPGETNLLQETLDHIPALASDGGFCFSAGKTGLVIFRMYDFPSPSHSSKLYSQNLQLLFKFSKISFFTLSSIINVPPAVYLGQYPPLYEQLQNRFQFPYLSAFYLHLLDLTLYYCKSTSNLILYYCNDCFPLNCNTLNHIVSLAAFVKKKLCHLKMLLILFIFPKNGLT